MSKAKKIVSFMLCLIMILALSVPAFAITSREGALYYQASQNVNYRSGPGEHYTSYGILNTGEMYVVPGRPTGIWYQGFPGEDTQLSRYYGSTYFYNSQGYINGSYLTSVG